MDLQFGSQPCFPIRTWGMLSHREFLVVMTRRGFCRKFSCSTWNSLCFLFHDSPRILRIFQDSHLLTRRIYQHWIKLWNHLENYLISQSFHIWSPCHVWGIIQESTEIASNVVRWRGWECGLWSHTARPWILVPPLTRAEDPCPAPECQDSVSHP